jgi:hypothetical protein
MGKLQFSGYFCATNLWFMDASWAPFYVVIALFILAIISPWVFPNKMVSNDKHDNKF